MGNCCGRNAKKPETVKAAKDEPAPTAPVEGEEIGSSPTRRLDTMSELPVGGGYRETNLKSMDLYSYGSTRFQDMGDTLEKRQSKPLTPRDPLEELCGGAESEEETDLKNAAQRSASDAIDESAPPPPEAVDSPAPTAGKVSRDSDLKEVGEMHEEKTAAQEESGRDALAEGDVVPPSTAVTFPDDDQYPEQPFPEDILTVSPDAEWHDVAEGGRYHGRLHDGQPENGVGYIEFTDGARYTGEFQDGVASGRGKYECPNGDVYIGGFVMGRSHGYGVFRFKDGSQYRGAFVNDSREGRGKEISTSGAVYVGDYQNNQKDGKGVLESVNGDKYDGDFHNGEIAGYGSYTWADGRLYVGDWLSNQQHGRGVFKWPDGRVYEGEYVHGKMHGRGVISWPDGRKYDGQWQEGRMEGEGVYWKDSTYWKVGLFHGGKVTRFFNTDWKTGDVSAFVGNNKMLQTIRMFDHA